MFSQREDEMAFRVRSSKFRHVFGSGAKKEHCYEGIKITNNAHDSNCCAVNPRFLAVITESAGGGAFLVVPISKVGRIDINAPKVCGHKGVVLDIKWNPFNDCVIASASDDTTVKVWQIPERGLECNLTEWQVDLHGHQRRVGYLEWHPTAENILLSAGFDFKCILWNTETAEPINIIDVHNDTIFSMCWNRNGSLFATTSKDKLLRIIDPRQGAVIAETVCHQGSKASKVLWLSEKHLFTVGFSRVSDRQCAVWDMGNLSKPIRQESVDSSSGLMTPFYDYDNKVIFLAGKGDGNIRYYEFVPDAPYIHFLSQYQSGSPQRGLGAMPKRGVDTKRCEIFRFFKLHTSKTLCEPVSMIVPRKSEMFQDDIYPPTSSACPSLSANEWISGQNRDPILVSLKDGVLTQSPAITTYKAVKRSPGVAEITTVPGNQAKRPTPPPNIISPPPLSSEKLPASVKNIQKLSISSDRVTRDSNSNETVNVFNSRRVFSNSEPTTRLTNANQPMHVDRKVWSSGYTSVTSEAQSVPQTDNEASLPVSITSTSSPPRLGSSRNPPSSSPYLIKPLKTTQVSPDTSYSAFHTPESPPDQLRTPSSPYSAARRSPVADLNSKTWDTPRDVSDIFSTPPTSPSKPPSSNRSGLSSLSPATSASWTSNPVYGQTDLDSSDPVDMAPLDDILMEQTSTASALDNTSAVSFNKPAKSGVYPGVSHTRRQVPTTASDTSSSRRYSYGSIIQQPVHSQDSVSRQFQEENTELIDNISVDAPDDTLIRPSKLRSSIRSKKRGSFHGLPMDVGTAGDRPSVFRDTWSPSRDNVSSDSDTVPSYPTRVNQPSTGLLARARTRETRSLTPSRSMRPPSPPTRAASSTVLKPIPAYSNVTTSQARSNSYHNDVNRPTSNYNRLSDLNKSTRNADYRQSTKTEPPSGGGLRQSERNDTADKGNFRTSTTLVFQKSPTVSPTIPDSNSPFRFTIPQEKTPTSTPFTFNLPGKTNGETRVNGHVQETGRDPRALTTKSSWPEEQHKVHVKKVWSPVSPPASTPENGFPFPHTDAESFTRRSFMLRKAYFHQVEEIKSLHQEIEVKDKRIRQLEEELQSLRGGRQEESNC